MVPSKCMLNFTLTRIRRESLKVALVLTPILNEIEAFRNP